MLKEKWREYRRQKKLQQLESVASEYSRIKKPTNVLFNIILTILSLISIVPFIFVIIISFTDENSLAMNGYRFIHEKWSTHAYSYILESGESILRSYGITILVTVSAIRR
nr:hypothetical protein [uncultured Butyricicoccus sp.]